MLRGDDVSELQRRLNALGFDAGREDGILGPETEAALRAVPTRRRPRARRCVRTGDDHRARDGRIARGGIGRAGARARRAAPAHRAGSATGACSSSSTPVSPRSASASRRRLARRGRGRRARRVGRRPRRARRAGQRVRRRRVHRGRHRHRARRALRLLRQPDLPERGRPLPRARHRPRRSRAVLPDVDEPVGPDLPAPARDRAWPRSCASSSRATSPPARPRSRPAVAELAGAHRRSASGAASRSRSTSHPTIAGYVGVGAVRRR